MKAKPFIALISVVAVAAAFYFHDQLETRLETHRLESETQAPAKEDGESATEANVSPLPLVDDPESLASLGGTKEVQTLVRMIQQERDAGRKAWLSQVLSSVKNPAGRNELLSHYLHDVDAEVVEGARRSLATVGDANFVRGLETAYQTATELHTTRIAGLVREMRQPDALPALEEIINKVGIAIEDELSMAALGALSDAGTPFAVAALARRMERASSEDEERILSQAFNRIERPGSDHELAAVANGHQDATKLATRIAAINALANYSTPIAKKTLAALEVSEEDAVAKAATEAMVKVRLTAP
jgi:hypothetical protein